ncbi:MAG: hypothetical protein ACE5I0_08350 [Candidatus Binatia bacterium]
MDRTDRLLLIAITILHILAQAYVYVSAPALLVPSEHKINRIAASLGVDPVAYRESFRYTTGLYPFLPPDTVWLRRSD